MNYPFNYQNMSSDNSKNQFMMHQSQMSIRSNIPETSVPQDMDKLFSYMKNVMSNPLLMDQMEKFLSAKEAEKNSSFINTYNESLSLSRMENQMKQPPDSYLIEPSGSYRPQPLKMGINQNVKKIKSPEINPNLKKASNKPSPYLEKHIQQNDKYFGTEYQQINSNSRQFQVKTQQKQRSNEDNVMKPVSKSAVSFEDMPIKSNYIASQQFSNFDPSSQTLAAYPQNESQYFKSSSVTLPKPKKPTVPKIPESKSTSNKYIELQDRPISGSNKDFKQLLKQKGIQSPFDQRPLPALTNNSSQNWNLQQQTYNEYQDTQDHEQQKPKRQFLKRGTRQYLSSAKDKKSTTTTTQQNKNKDLQQTLNNSRFGADKEKDKTPTKRDVSQNRILSKRNTINTDKSVTKLKPKQNLNDSNQESFYEQKYESTKRSITPKNQRSAVQSKSPILPPKNTKQQTNVAKINKSNLQNQGSAGKKKNVFEDSSSSDQNQQNNSQNHQEYQSNRTNNLMENNTSQNVKNNKNVNSYQPDQEFNMFSRQKKEEVIQGVFLTKNQLQSILQKYSPKITSSSKNLNSSQEKFNQLRKKYTDLCNLVQKQKIEHEQQMQKQREQFQSYKQQQMQKIKNQRRVMERQVKSSMPSQSQNLQKDKEEIQNLKKQLQKQKQEHKKKQKNNKILIEKYKKQNQELKFRVQRLQEELQNKGSLNSLQNNFSSSVSERQTTNNTTNSRSTLMNDKSKSKSTLKDVSPAKGKMNKTSKKPQQNQQQEPLNDKNYKKTVPLYKSKQQKSQKFSASYQNKNQNLKNNEENSNSDDENLPTFKIQNKPKDQIKTKTQKKYQYVQNSVQTNKVNKKQNQKTHGKEISNHQRKKSNKNVFDDDSEDQSFEKDHEQNDGQFNNEEDDAGFFKKQPKFESLSDLISNNFSIKCVNPQLIQNLFRYQNNVEYRRYLSRINSPKRIIVNSSKNGVDKKITNIYSDKSKEILFQNGVKKQIFQDGYTIIYFKNGDLKQKLTDGTILYYFKEKQVDQITLINGLNIYRFQNNQVELHFDGGKYIQISHPDGTIKILGSPVH